jgi:O-antigen/teichoic acid export membrane protein
VRQLWRSPALRTAGIYGAAGVGFAAANLLLARVLPTQEYALVTLVIALANVGYALSPLGLDGIVNRRSLEAGPRLLRKTLLATSLTGVGFAVVGAVVYEISAVLTAVVLISTMVGGATMVAAAQFQSERRFGRSLVLAQSPNLILLLAAVITLAADVRDARLPLLLMAAGWFPLAIWGWGTLLGERHAKPARDAAIPWGEALTFAGMAVTGLVMIQLERLVLPHVLPARDLATFGVLGAIAGSLFRVLQMGVGYTLVPRLREAGTVQLRRKLVAREARLVGVVVLVGSAAIWVLTPWVEQLLLGDKYHLGSALIFAAVVSGIAKVVNSFARAAAVALATSHELWVSNVVGWLAVVVATAAGVAGARWGLAGVIYGVTVGWVLRSVPTFWYAARHLRLAEDAPVGQPAIVP